MKKALSFLLAALMLVMVIPFSTSAKSDPEGAYAVLKEGAYACSDYIDIERFNLTADELFDVVDKLLKNEPMLFQATGAYSYYYYNPNEPTAVVFEYYFTGDDYENATEFVEDELEMILSLIPEGLSDIEKALFLHDYLCVNFEYDLNYGIYDIYNFLLYDTGVCMAYSLLYDELLYRIGIETRAVISPEYSINHMWNEIKLDGKWYHVDTTWDDPTPDRFAYSGHSYYLICDDCAYEQHENCVYFADYDCDDKTYEDLDWRRISTPFAFANGNIYGLDSATIVEIELTSGTMTEIERVFEAGWKSADGTTYLGYKSGFGGYKNILFYNTEDAIMAYDPSTGNEKVILQPDNGIIIGLYINGNEIHYCASTTGYSEDGMEYVYNIKDSDLVFASNPTPDPNPDPNPDVDPDPDPNPDPEPDPNPDVDPDPDPDPNPDVDPDPDPNPDDEKPMPIYSIGDVNGDDKVDQYDYILVKRHYFGTRILNEIEILTADVNADGTVNQYDYILIKRVYFGTFKL